MTGTTVGLEASPGDTTNGQPPSVIFGYKRAEVAIIPVPRDNPGATDGTTTPPTAADEAPPQAPTEHKDDDATKKSMSPTHEKTDAFSVLASFNLAHNWFGPAKVEQFIATGHAARQIQGSILGSVAGITGTLASKFKNLQTNNADSGCWRALQGWKNVHLPAVKEKDFVEDPKHEDNRAMSLKNAAVINACQGQAELR